MSFHMPDSWYIQPDPHECDDEDCDGDLCADREAQAYEDAQIERADSIRKGEW